MAPRAQWKGYLKIDEISCAVALYTAASTSDRTSFHTVNKATGNRVKRVFVEPPFESAVEDLREDACAAVPIRGGAARWGGPDERPNN